MKIGKYKYYVLVGSSIDCWLGVCTKKRYINYLFNGYSARKELKTGN